MVIGVYCNKRYLDDSGEYVCHIKARLDKSGDTCKTVRYSEDLDGVQILMVLGGDGTILAFASECARRSIKIIGINFGHLGFLTDFESSKLDEAIDVLLSGNYLTQKRAMLEICYADKKFYALNDLVIQRSTAGNSFSNTIDLCAEIDGSTVDNFSSDGLIISTPTGSTAYSLAAGGSILTPDLNAFILTPICPHSLHSRPIVFSDKSTLKIRRIDSRSELNVIVDGKAVDCINELTVTVRKADCFVEFITAQENDFFGKLLMKLNLWSK